VTDLASWLLEQIADDEHLARASGGKVWTRDPHETGQRIEGDDIHIYPEGGHDEDQAEHIARWDPKRVLAECAAKRRIIEQLTTEWADAVGLATPAFPAMSGRVTLSPAAALILRDLALPYADRPGYLEEWKP
jgi:hypothetical protein